jgi:hypothetical protein
MGAFMGRAVALLATDGKWDGAEIGKLTENRLFRAVAASLLMAFAVHASSPITVRLP